MGPKQSWTKEYCGLSHLGEFSTKHTWVTVERFDDGSAVLNVWFPGCQFSPTVSHHASVEIAKSEGERIMAQQA